MRPILRYCLLTCLLGAPLAMGCRHAECECQCCCACPGPDQMTWPASTRQEGAAAYPDPGLPPAEESPTPSSVWGPDPAPVGPEVRPTAPAPRPAVPPR